MKKRNKTKQKISNVLASSNLAIIGEQLSESGLIDNNAYYYKAGEIIDKLSMIKSIIGEYCPTATFHNATDTICISDKDFSNAFINVKDIVREYLDKMDIPFVEAINDINAYANTRKVLVTPTGIVKFYNIATNSMVVAGSSIETFQTTATAQVSGASGTSLLAASPVTIITVPTMLGLSLAQLECLTKGTAVSPIFHVSARVCLIPLKIAEVTINNVVLIIPSKILGIPLVSS